LSSWVAFTETELLIGDDTTNQVRMNPHNTIFDVKRLNVHKTRLTRVMYNTSSSRSFTKTASPHSVQVQGQDQDLFSEEISSMILVKMKKTRPQRPTSVRMSNTT
jgi:heat shock protein 1/8